MLQYRLTILFLLLANSLFSQIKPTLGYYLPAISFDAAIPTPTQFLGFEIGEHHISHDQLLAYMHALDQASDRIALRTYGHTHEGRPMICLTITDPANHARLPEIQKQRQQLLYAATSASVDLKNMPAVNYMGYSIHGNEASGANASLLVAYYLTAAQTPEVQALLRNTIILLDPCFNPDGMQRFSSWVNSRRSINGTGDAVNDEFNEPWPRGRTNHYWFDLNRDWLVTQQPETPGRVAIFQEWHPNVLTDHHEMGSNATFFFQPGVPSRVNPITPIRNQELTTKIGQYHAQLLSEKKVLFYTGENYDDFYYGKGSTYPDANGCIGILFEQASSRGSAQQTENGLLTFAYSIRNQVFTSLSTLKAVGEMRVELNEYLRSFYQTAVEEARKNPVKGYLINNVSHDRPAYALLEILLEHGIEVRNVQENISLNGQQFPAGNTFWIPTEQPQYRLVRGIFEHQTTFTDSIFYDISAWTLPDAFGLQWAPVQVRDFKSSWIDPNPGMAITSRYGAAIIGTPAYAYALDAVGYELPQVMALLFRAGLQVKLAMQPFQADGRRMAAGSILIPGDNQPMNETVLLQKMNEISAILPVFTISNGLTAEGPDLGSSSFVALRAPKVVLITGDGISPESAGEVWHLLDTRYNLPVTLVEGDRFPSVNLSKYNVLILPDGSLGNLSIEKVREFASGGGTVVAIGSALRWLDNANLVDLNFRNGPAKQSGRRPYASIAEDKGARNLPGAIFEAELDLTNPLCFGYTRPTLPLFLGDTIFVETAKNPYATPLVFTENPLLAGYIHPKQKGLVARSAAVVTCGLGKGKIICFAGDPNFRGFWYGTNRLFANAIFFGNVLNADGVERKP